MSPKPSLLRGVPTVPLASLPELAGRGHPGQGRRQALEDADAARRIGDQRFRALCDQAPILVWTSGPDGAHEWFNRRWLDFVGRTRQ